MILLTEDGKRWTLLNANRSCNLRDRGNLNTLSVVRTSGSGHMGLFSDFLEQGSEAIDLVH